MSNFDAVILQLKQARERAVREANQLDAALSALGGLNGSFRGARPKRTGKPMSASARREDRGCAEGQMGTVAEGTKGGLRMQPDSCRVSGALALVAISIRYAAAVHVNHAS
jgi:hypothetical protein